MDIKVMVALQADDKVMLMILVDDKAMANVTLDRASAIKVAGEIMKLAELIPARH